jgi:steroid 5-alpha reductase family enzyme
MGAAGFFVALVTVAVFLSVAMSGAWLLWRRTGNAGWVDTTWTFAVGTAGAGGAITALLAGLPAARPLVVLAFAVAWALRLGLHIARRTGGISDDPRYARLAAGWGADAPRQMFILLQKQALVSIPLGLAMVLAAWNPAPFAVGDWIAILVLVTAIAGEGLADKQLRAFRAEPANRGRICDVGLWSWSRHPNYFFEWLGWIAYPLLAIDLAGGHPFGWAALAAPLCMYWLLVRVSGIPPLEAHMVEKHGAAYRAYQARVSAFFPVPSQHGAAP